MPTLRMLAVRPVNLRIGNLSRHSVSEVVLTRDTLVLHFCETGQSTIDFRLQLDGLLGFVDRGAVLQPFTAGIVWAPPGPFGLELAARLACDPATLLELRLDFEDPSGLVSRFAAVARTIRVM